MGLLLMGTETRLSDRDTGDGRQRREGRRGRGL